MGRTELQKHIRDTLCILPASHSKGLIVAKADAVANTFERLYPPLIDVLE